MGRLFIGAIGILMAATMLLGIFTASPVSAKGEVLDVNCSDSVDSLDAAIVLQYQAGIIDVYPCDWPGSGRDAFSPKVATCILWVEAGLVPLEKCDGLLPSPPSRF